MLRSYYKSSLLNDTEAKKRHDESAMPPLSSIYHFFISDNILYTVLGYKKTRLPVARQVALTDLSGSFLPGTSRPVQLTRRGCSASPGNDVQLMRSIPDAHPYAPESLPLFLLHYLCKIIPKDIKAVYQQLLIPETITQPETFLFLKAVSVAQQHPGLFVDIVA